jgi:hypothetical protein
LLGYGADSRRLQAGAFESSSVTLAPGLSVGLAPLTALVTAIAAVAGPESRIAEWEALVDSGARDFVVESVLIAPNPAMSIVSMNGGVFRVGESVMFADQSIRYEIRAVDATSVTLAARWMTTVGGRPSRRASMKQRLSSAPPLAPLSSLRWTSTRVTRRPPPA